MSTVTPYQPVLPAEGVFSDAEISFLDDSPPGLFPENQNSNFGLILRKTFTDKIQDLIGQQQTLYNEDYVQTSVAYLDMWEADYGLPMNPAGRSVAQRRQDVLSRIQVGPFTRSRRAAVVENYIIPTFGAGVLLFPAGVTIGSGIPLYSGASSLAGTYVIRENYTWKNSCTNSNFETNITGWGTGSSFWINTGATLSRDISQAKFGVASLKVVTPGILASEGASYTGINVVSGQPITASAYVNAPVGATMRIGLGDNIVGAIQSTFLGTGAWQRISATLVPTASGTTLFGVGVWGGATAAITFYVDGVQIEQGAVATDWSDPAGQDFFYEVRILNSVTPDLVALTRELTRITPAGIQFAIVSTPSP